MLRASVVGLTGIGASRPTGNSPFADGMPESHVAAYAVDPRTEIVAVCDLKEEMLDRFKQVWHDLLPEVRTYTDYREMRSLEQIDLLSVVTSDNCHADIVVDAAAHRVKGIICEKPIATALEDADRMIAAVERAGIPMSIEHTRRYRPIYHQARDLIRAGAIGPLARVVAQFGGPRAMLFRNGTHLIDIVNFFVEADPAWVFAELDAGFEDYLEYRGDGGRSPESDPGGSGFVHYANGVRAFFNCSKGLSQPFEVELMGAEGNITLRDDLADLCVRDNDGNMVSRPLLEGTVQRKGIPAAVDEMVRLVLEGGQSVSPPSEGRKALEIIIGFLQSQHRGNAKVEFPLTNVP